MEFTGAIREAKKGTAELVVLKHPSNPVESCLGFRARTALTESGLTGKGFRIS